MVVGGGCMSDRIVYEGSRDNRTPRLTKCAEGMDNVEIAIIQ